MNLRARRLARDQDTRAWRDLENGTGTERQEVAAGATGAYLREKFFELRVILQLSSSGGDTGNGSGATDTPSSISAFASSGVAWPWIVAWSRSP